MPLIKIDESKDFKIASLSSGAPCSHTHVDLETCTQCGREWLPHELEEIEILDDVVVAA